MKNGNVLEKDKKHVSISIADRDKRGLDWAQSSWTRWLHVLFWFWLNPILNLGYQRQLNEDDFFELSPNDDCDHLMKKLETQWDRYPTMKSWRIILKTFWKSSLYAGLILVPYIGTKIAQPLLLKQVVLSINDPTIPVHIGYLYAVALGVLPFLQATMHHQFFFRTTRVGAQVRVSVSSLVYKRLLCLPTTALAKTTTGQLINLISNDIGKFEELCAFMHHMWAAPLEAAIVFGLIWNEIGIATLFGYAVLLLLVPIQLYFSRKFGTYRKSTVSWTDKRVKVINEILVGCQIVKMYRWEEPMESVVYDARKNEFKSIRKASRIRSTNLGISFSSLALVSLTTFGGSWLMGKSLNAANIFMILSLFSLVRVPITIFIPYAIEKWSESMISSKRFDEFMTFFREAQSEPTEKTRKSNGNGTGMPGSLFMKQASFIWSSNVPANLNRLDLKIDPGSLVGVIGSIGSGKSSFLAALLGEMSLVEGNSEVNGTISYSSQTPWIFAGTVRENILFYKPFDQERYERVLKCCCLIDDLNTFQAADLTIIGEKGVNLSGGQKARVSLARALYNEADIYLFDDPLAAVDSRVAKIIFKECLSKEGMLNGKTRILVTHRLEFMSNFDHCILLENGQIEKQSSFEELLQVEKVMEAYQKQMNYSSKFEENRKTGDISSKDIDDDKTLKTGDKNGILQEETSSGGNISAGIWFKLFTARYGWIGLLPLIFFLLLGECLYDGTNKWLSVWSSQSENDQRKHFYPGVYLGLVLGTSIVALVRVDLFYKLILSGASALHNQMFKGVLYTSLRFYESNPVGRILNRFSKDQQVIDELLPLSFFDAIQVSLMAIGSVVIIGMANPWALIILVLIIPAFIWLRRFYIKSSREIKRLDSITRSPIYALFSSSLSGLITIRAFNAQDQFVKTFTDKVNANSRIFIVLLGTARWFGFRLDVMSCCLTFLTAVLSMALRKSLDPSAVALGLSYCINLTALFQWGIRQSVETENFMTSTERINEYAHLPCEPEFHEGNLKPPANWPLSGKIDFNNFKFRYRSELEPVLKGVNLSIESGKKIGVIGRTGAGKSSIFQALFRLTDKTTTEGQILIDGIDINMLSLNAVRSSINIIPQSPVLFSNTLRYNLDPFKQYADEQLWDALAAVQLKGKILALPDQLNTLVAEYGSNFSVGECQLIAVARAILKKTRILLIDEATAHVDTKTDDLIQLVLREKFADQTVLTIAHRLNTVMDCDKIVVMQNGIVADYRTPKDLIFKNDDLTMDSADGDDTAI